MLSQPHTKEDTEIRTVVEIRIEESIITKMKENEIQEEIRKVINIQTDIGIIRISLLYMNQMIDVQKTEYIRH